MMPSTGSKKNVMNPTMKEVLNPVHLLIPEERKRNRQINYQTELRVNYLYSIYIYAIALLSQFVMPSIYREKFLRGCKNESFTTNEKS